MSITASILNHSGERVAAVVGARIIPYRELCADIHRAATFLRTQGLGPGSTVAIYLGRVGSRLDYPTWVAHLAALRIGATHASVHVNMSNLLAAMKVDAVIGQLPPDTSAPEGLAIIPFELQSMPPAED